MASKWVTPAILEGLKRRRDAIVEGRKKGARLMPFRESSLGSHRWSIVDVATSGLVDVPMVAEVGEERIITSAIAFRSKTEAQRAIAFLESSQALLGKLRREQP